ncbi:hypothetical protein [Massilia sp. CCM 8734]|uniref:hypothetical protein n=1 Tax=Massilia sp. CCM 8734 TaxID=2609283 RepID=UPI0014249FCC|nr:hypothetical protein [Massilia sp. CCM 8734]NHZ95305.1 hypothetical protein [Massilia sp. CCM 8734]
MLSKLLKAFPGVFSLRPSSDYSEYGEYGGVRIHQSAAEMMRDNWAGIGRRMEAAIDKVGLDVEQQKNK